ncbi:glycosyltransferase family 2 protein [bacterium]|nr:glycosyltransferase family 2 protein [bacterium]
MGEIMTKIAYYYTGKKEYLEKLLDYDLTILIDNENCIEEIINFNKPIKILKFDTNTYDILISETDNMEKIFARKKVVIGKGNKKRIQYIEKFDIKEILKENKKQETIKFSIIVPNYNNGEWISKTIESALNQTYNNWEMYIIDDMSTDNSIEVINKYKDDRITLIQNEIKLYNGGSRNVGILKAKKSNINGYLLFIDSDDWLANNQVLEKLNDFIDNEDLITLQYQYYMDNQIQPAGKCSYNNKDELFMTIGCMCAVWCKCFRVDIAPLFEFNTLMEDRNYHYRLINRINTYSNFDEVTHTWNKMNKKSVTSNKTQKYDSDLQAKIEWDNCAYRHIAGMLDLLNELTNPLYINFIKKRINQCNKYIQNGSYLQY